MVIHEQQRETSKEFTERNARNSQTTERNARNSQREQQARNSQREQQGAGVSEASGLRPRFI
jgi:hypothetical protein